MVQSCGVSFLGEGMPRKLPKHVVEDIDRYKKSRYYLRIKGRKKVRLDGIPWTASFMEAYEKALSGEDLKSAAPMPQTWQWLCTQYFASFGNNPTRYQMVLRRRLEATFMEPTRPGGTDLFKDMPLSAFGRKAVRVLRDRKADVPEGANNRLKAIRNVFTWANREIEDFKYGNPGLLVEKLTHATDGYYTWSIDDVRQYQAYHRTGTKARLALALGLWAGGPRRVDLVRLGPQMIRNGVLKYKSAKSGAVIELPVLPELQAEIDAAPKGHLTFLVTEFGKPFTPNGFGNWFKRRCREAGLPQCTAHGMRKAGATIAAENGATDAQLQALFGWETARMAAHYRKQAQQRRLAADAVGLMSIKEG